MEPIEAQYDAVSHQSDKPVATEDAAHLSHQQRRERDIQDYTRKLPKARRCHTGSDRDREPRERVEMKTRMKRKGTTKQKMAPKTMMRTRKRLDYPSAT